MDTVIVAAYAANIWQTLLSPQVLEPLLSLAATVMLTLVGLAAAELRKVRGAQRYAEYIDLAERAARNGVEYAEQVYVRAYNEAFGGRLDGVAQAGALETALTVATAQLTDDARKALDRVAAKAGRDAKDLLTELIEAQIQRRKDAGK